MGELAGRRGALEVEKRQTGEHNCLSEPRPVRRDLFCCKGNLRDLWNSHN